MGVLGGMWVAGDREFWVVGIGRPESKFTVLKTLAGFLLV